MKSYISAAIICLGIILSALFLSKAYKYKFTKSETITVTGKADYDFTADLVVWSCSFNHKSMQMKDAYADLKKDQEAISSYLHEQGLTDQEIVFSSVEIQKNYDDKYDANNVRTEVFSGYSLTQSVKIESGSIDKVETISREISKLIEQGVELTSEEPSYYYSKLSQLKLDLIAKASEDGRKRAEAIAKNANATLGSLRDATLDFFQITGQNSNEDFSYGGAYNTSSKKKTASVTVRMKFAVN